jgi:arylsulfatase A-like enzyme
MAAVVGAAILAFHLARPVLPSHTPPNILLITLDTTRADRLGAYGYRLASTARLDRLATEGVVFERAVAAAPITLPAHASLMTGSYPFVHGVRNNGNFSLRETLPTLATTLHDRGYRTGAFVSAFVLDRRYGLGRGFDVYDDQVHTRAARRPYGRGRGAMVHRAGDRSRPVLRVAASLRSTRSVRSAAAVSRGVSRNVRTTVRLRSTMA